MADPNDNTNIVLPHLSLFAGFCRPQTDTRHHSHMLDGSPRHNTHPRDGNINAMSQAEFDALPTWSDIEDEPDYNRQQPRDAPPRYSACVDSYLTPLLPRVAVVETDDDAGQAISRHGFWSETVVPTYDSILTSFPAFRGRSTEMCERKGRGKMGFWAFCCFWIALCVGMLATVGVAFALDLGASRYGYGIGIAAYVVGGGEGHEMGGSGREMRFCLTTPNRFAPGAQKWRYLAPLASTDCDTQILTLQAGPAEAWKIHTSDELQIEHEAGNHVARRHEGAMEKQNYVTVADRIRALESGDNLAEEGVLGQGR
ncbi:hypothetical protein T440DRAFT_482321 [Plenodomus tracheiphilus IPT5]|uniref:Uncharacterized protein n=1 Tax=Plenodomus tracheiphilus IPT5 TaxID=1408161 RepID=A0A6A7AX48_9PLEO|nr:hypothetical protein T440DRAFT_482321 [Plenodomus tracheiphilus IPT5]